MALATILIIVKGKVQGVFYRQSTRELAEKLSINGSVKNKKDGSVEIIATGDEEQLEQLINWCKQGPSRAVVSTVETSPLPLKHFTKFIIDRV